MVHRTGDNRVVSNISVVDTFCWYCICIWCRSSIFNAESKSHTELVNKIRVYQKKSFSLSVAYMRQWTGSALVKAMACRLFGSKPLPEPMLANCQLDSSKQISAKFESEFYHFYLKKCIWKCRLPKWRPFPQGGDKLSKMSRGLIQ